MYKLYNNINNIFGVTQSREFTDILGVSLPAVLFTLTIIYFANSVKAKNKVRNEKLIKGGIRIYLTVWLAGFSMFFLHQVKQENIVCIDQKVDYCSVNEFGYVKKGEYIALKALKYTGLNIEK